MLARDEVLLDLDLLEQLRTQLELHRISELGKVAAEHQEVGGRTQGLDFLDRPDSFLDEALIYVPGIKMRVGEPRELEPVLCVGDFDGVEEREPTVGRSCDHRAGQQGSMQKDSACDVD